jgi:FSR family fosmidomycin resistance protein-like MFS transporter
VDRRVLAQLSYGHLATDLAQGALPALLPLFKTRYHLSYTDVGFIVLMANISSSVIQPVFGLVSDRLQMRWIMPAGTVTAGTALLLAVHAPSYWVMVALIFLSGLGVAAFHPEGYRYAGLASGARRATGMSYFSVGGNLGFGLGPAAASVALSLAGPHGMAYLPLVALPAAVLLWKVTDPSVRGRLEAAWTALGAVQPADAPASPRRGRASRGPLALLVLYVILRSWIQLGIASFIPLYFTGIRHMDPRFAGAVISVFLGSGALGTMLGGPAADRWGRRITLIVSMASLPPLLWVLTRASGTWTLAVATLASMEVVSTFAVVMVMAQELIPERIGMISGLIIGFAVGTGGVGVTLLGAVADRWGVLRALDITALLPVAALAVALFLPPDLPRHAHAAAPRPRGGRVEARVGGP